MQPPSHDANEIRAAQRELEAALAMVGAESVFMCSKGEVSPAGMRAVAASIRSLELSSEGIRRGEPRQRRAPCLVRSRCDERSACIGK